MSDYLEFTIGDDVVVPIQLVTDEAENFSVDPAATVRAALWHNNSKVTVGPVTLDPDDIKADWATGLLVARFPAAITIGLQAGPTTLELELDDSGKQTVYHRCITVVAGQIA